ncbi:integrase/recombinase XerD [Terribacillus halophilus]|uniref:Integrase/recombinase XerD n=1 Tax=Terribacillus halophilus TaxID=361279 RepID=A0A1G6VNF3_9BACI|nr:tyrosine-type recombinase/integrase [Terribacillus halophilus]SDD55071.1 integrase/recombinase XerD [Terribacillus halophilus]
MDIFLIELDRYMIECQSRGLSNKTMSSYDQTLRLFHRYLIEQQDVNNPAKVKRDHITEYFIYIRQRGKYGAFSNDMSARQNRPHNRSDFGREVSETTLANYQRNINAFFNYLYRNKIIKKNPCEGIEKIRPVRKVKSLLTENELKLFFTTFDVSRFHEYRNWIIARLILDTGARIGELLETLPTDIDIRNGAMLLRMTKSGKERIVYFSQKMGRELKSWLEYKDRYSDSPHVFPSTRGKKMDVRNIETAFKKHSRMVGLDVQPHQLRNNFAKYYLVNGRELAEARRR